MKKYTAIIFLILFTTVLFAQKKEKIRGSKKVITEQKEISDFRILEIGDNLEVYLEKGEKPELKIEADNNLTDIISITHTDSTLSIYTSKEAFKYKKLTIHLTYTNDLISVTSKNKSVVNAIKELQLESIHFKSLDDSKLFLNVKTKDFQLESNNKSKTELNLKAERTKIKLNHNASLKSLIITSDFECDFRQKSVGRIEGNATNGLMKLNDNSSLTASKFTIKNLDITTTASSVCSVNAETIICVNATQKSEIEIYGSPTFEIIKFADEAKLIKKSK
jgi:hypothetical protein